MLSKSEENYLKTIYNLSLGIVGPVSTNAIAEQLDTKASSVTDMIKKLAEKALITYKKYHGVSLTNSGKTIAINIIRKHRLWEVFLVSKLNFNWDEVHEVAEQLEHIHSEKLINELDEFLGFPKQDPHGDPIPDEHGNISFLDKSLLASIPSNEEVICVGVRDTSSDFLKYLDKQGISLGVKITITEKESFDNSMRIQINNSTLNISSIVASNIYVKR